MLIKLFDSNLLYQLFSNKKIILMKYSIDSQSTSIDPTGFVYYWLCQKRSVLSIKEKLTINNRNILLVYFDKKKKKDRKTEKKERTNKIQIVNINYFHSQNNVIKKNGSFVFSYNSLLYIRRGGDVLVSIVHPASSTQHTLYNLQG